MEEDVKDGLRYSKMVSTVIIIIVIIIIIIIIITTIMIITNITTKLLRKTPDPLGSAFQLLGCL